MKAVEFRPPPPSVQRRWTAIVLGSAAVLAAVSPAWAGLCSVKTPAASVPEALWDGLAPAAAQPFADATAYNGHVQPNDRHPLYMSLDIEGDLLYSVYAQGFAIFDISDPNHVTRNGIYDVRSEHYPRPLDGFSERKFFVWDVDVPAGRPDVAVAVGNDSHGLVVWKIVNGEGEAVYQDSGNFDTGKHYREVFTAEVGNRLYAFAAGTLPDPGVHLYDVTAALTYDGCGENTYRSIECPGVYKGRLGDPRRLEHLDAVANGDGSYLFAFSGGVGGDRGMGMFEVRAQGGGLVTTSRLTALDGERVQGVALWKQSSKTYLAVRTLEKAQIYDVTSCSSGFCSSLAGKEVGPPLALGLISGWQSVVFSRSGHPTLGRPFLYFGNETYCHSGLQKEWLYDVSDPSAPVEITGDETMVVSGPDGETATVDYWSFYYTNNPSGFTEIAPRMGKFAGNYFFRAARTIMDAHELRSVEPAIGLTGPSGTIYQDTAESFTASASNCTPSSTWTWSAGADATITGSGATVDIAWSQLGSKSVVASNSGCGAAEGVLPVEVNDPAPVIGAVTASPTTAFVCQPISFTATGVGGKSPLTRAWRVEPAAGGTATALGSTTDTAVWTPQSSTTAGQYAGFLKVSGEGSPAEKSALVDVEVPGPLPAPGSFAPSVVPGYVASTVTLKLDPGVANAAKWVWDFGDGDVETTEDRTAGEQIEHTYSQADVDAKCGGVPCTFDVKVTVSNCVHGESTSAVLPVVIDQVNPLEITTFQGRGCFAFGCNYNLDEPVTFDLVVTGDPTGYQFDWNGDGTFEDTTSTPVADPEIENKFTVIHPFEEAGTFFPRAKALRGSEFEIAVHLQQVQVSDSTVPKSISISGLGSGTVGQSLSFTATASGCTPSSSGWTWNKGGGSGSSTSNQITLSWSSSGTKNISATNSACSGVSGSKSVSISSAGPDPDPDPDPDPEPSLKPLISFSPASPKVGQKVSFDASASTGSPDVYYWLIDNKEYLTQKVEHTFEQAGVHDVFLEISKKSTACSTGLCSRSTVVKVAVGGAAPDPEPDTGDNGCTGAAADDENKLCLGSGRFEVEVDFTDQHNGTTGRGQAVKFPGSERTGFFWFFRPTNFELMLKILDGTPVNGKIWVFYGATTNVGYTIEVTDTVTGAKKTYESLPGTFCGRADTAAFPADQAASAALAGAPSGATRASEATHQGAGDAPGDAPGTSETLTLLGRFEVGVDFSVQDEQGQTVPGKGKAIPGTDQSGYFWFFREDNLELLVKMVDATALDGYFWAFIGALSNVAYTVHVHDPVTDQDWEFVNPEGSYCGGYDGHAFFVGD